MLHCLRLRWKHARVAHVNIGLGLVQEFEVSLVEDWRALACLLVLRLDRLRHVVLGWFGGRELAPQKLVVTTHIRFRI